MSGNARSLGNIYTFHNGEALPPTPIPPSYQHKHRAQSHTTPLWRRVVDYFLSII